MNPIFPEAPEDPLTDEADDLYQLAKHAAIDLLSRREHTAQEIQQKLSRRKKLGHFDFGPLIEELMTAGWLSHERFAENFIRSRRNKYHGPVKIQHALRQRGLKDSEFTDHLGQYEDWNERAAELLTRRFNQPPVDSKERARMQRFLQGRGFNYESIQYAISCLNENDDLPQYD